MLSVFSLADSVRREKLFGKVRQNRIKNERETKPDFNDERDSLEAQSLQANHFISFKMVKSHNENNIYINANKINQQDDVND